MSGMLSRRRAMSIVQTAEENYIYKGTNLICDGATFFDTGYAPFSSDHINDNFKITIRISSFTANNALTVVLGCKYEGTLNGQLYPGFYLRRYNSTQRYDIGGYNYYRPTIASVLNKNLYIWRDNGIFFAQIEGDSQVVLSVRSTEFNQNIIIGAGVQTNGTKFRYATCVIDYVKIELLLPPSE